MILHKKKIVFYSTGIIPVLMIWYLLCVIDGAMSNYTILNSILIIILSYIAMICDITGKKIPNNLVLIMIAVWMLLITGSMFFDLNRTLTTMADSISGMFIGGGLFLLVYLISRKGLGGGDVKFMAAAGLYLGFSGTVPAILYGTVLAALTGLAMIILKKIDRKDTMPLVPFLFIGIIIALVF